MAWIDCRYMNRIANLGSNVLLFPDVVHQIQSHPRNPIETFECLANSGVLVSDAVVGYQVVMI